jgi:hypothetical protein
MVALRYKRIPRPIYSPDLAIANLYPFGKVKEEFRTMQASSEKEAVEAVTDIPQRRLHSELKSGFDHWVI